MGTWKMSAKEVKRVETLGLVRKGALTLVEASEVLALSYRQAKRVWRRFQREGVGGLVHQSRGRVGNRRLPARVREKALTLVKQKYGDYGSTLAAECLAEEDGLTVQAETLRRWRIAAGLWKSRGTAVHRMRRPRRSCAGQMVQMDGSEHDWLEGRGPRCSLMVIIDDATNWTYARFYPSETLAAAMDCFRRYIQWRGIPHELYVDRDSIYRSDRAPTAQEVLSGTGPLTQFGRAMTQLSIRLILAGSPQAKGRVERRHGVFQDRLIKALRRRKISRLTAANAYLDREFLRQLNARFNVAPANPTDVHRRVGRLNLNLIFCRRENRTVGLDWCVLYENRVFQLLRREQRLALVRRVVEVHEQLDGHIVIRYQGRDLAWREIHAPRRVPAENVLAAAAGAPLPPGAPAAAPFNPALKRKKGTFLLW